MYVGLWNIFKCIILLILTNSFVLGQNHDIYKGYSVYSVPLASKSDQNLFHSLANELNLDVWHQGTPEFRPAAVLVSPEDKNEFLEGLQKLGLKSTVELSDVATSLTQHFDDILRWKTSRSNRLIPFEDYPRVDEINAYLDRIAAEYPGVASVQTAGLSYEGREIKYLKISTTNFTDTSKPIYFMDGALHAREWVTTPVALYSIHRLVEDVRTADHDLVTDVDWIILPVANPDGYEYSHTDDRLWRRSRSVDTLVNTTCLGVDLNRNFDVNFNTVGVSSDPCSQTYPGRIAFSDPESRYVRDILLSNIDRLQLYLNIHSYGHYVLFGYGNASLPANAAQLHHVGATIGAEIDASKLDEGDYYKVGNSALVLYGSSGSAQDYGQAVGVPFSYTLELPGYSYMFEVPPRYIAQINEETWRGIAASARLSAIYYRARSN